MITDDIEIVNKKRHICCANGSKMVSSCETKLLVEIAGKSAFQTFVVVDDIFPRVFIGIRTLKHDCAIVNKKRVPFISYTEDISVITHKENGHPSNSGAGI